MKNAKIYTRTGDKGETSLVGGTRLSKGHELIHLYGEVDELNSHIGMAIALLKNELSLIPQSGQSDWNRHVQFLLKQQELLFNLGSNLACEVEKRSQFQLPKIEKVDIENVESHIDDMDQKLTPLKNFVLPGGSMSASQIHICRTVCRRVERNLIHAIYENIQIKETEKFELPYNSIEYLNRLSDYFFVLSRFINFFHSEEEILWKPSN